MLVPAASILFLKIEDVLHYTNLFLLLSFDVHKPFYNRAEGFSDHPPGGGGGGGGAAEGLGHLSPARMEGRMIFNVDFY